MLELGLLCQPKKNLFLDFYFNMIIKKPMEPGSDVNKVESIFLEEKKCGSFCYMYLVKRGGGLTLCILRNS